MDIFPGGKYLIILQKNAGNSELSKKYWSIGTKTAAKSQNLSINCKGATVLVGVGRKAQALNREFLIFYRL